MSELFAAPKNARGSVRRKEAVVWPEAFDAVDLLILLPAWGRNPGHPADFNGNGSVGASDLLALLADWGPCP